jgi:hypothetical protein
LCEPEREHMLKHREQKNNRGVEWVGLKLKYFEFSKKISFRTKIFSKDFFSFFGVGILREITAIA